MRVRIIRWTDPTSSAARLRVDRWCDGQWERVQDFGLYESNEANEFAMKLSLTKRVPVELAVFEDGEKFSQVVCKHPMGFPCICGALTSEKVTGDQS